VRYRRLPRYLINSGNYLSFGKVVNYLKYRSDLRNRNIVASSFPPQIAFEASAYCNSNCQLCPVGLRMEGPQKGFLESTRFKQILDSSRKYLIRIDFGDWGEPFLNPDIFKMIEYAERNKVMTAASTNLHWFKDKKDLNQIFSSGLSFLTISLHGVSQETYQAYQPGKNFEDTLSKINSLVDLKRRSKTSKPIIDLVFAITKKNQHEIRRMDQFAKNLGVDSITYTASLNLRFYLHNPPKLTEITNEWAPYVKSGFHDDSAFGKERTNKLYKAVLERNLLCYDDLDRAGLTGRHSCVDPWRSLVVNWDGTVSLCCVDYGKYIMGDTHTESIIEIWNNNKYQAVRNYLRGTGANDSEIPCKRCIMY